MKRVIIVQARMTSTRLPGKILMDLAGRPMLAQQVRRLKRCQLADEIVIATTNNSGDDPVIQVARAEGVRWYRGSEEDVLSRYVGAARESHAEVVVRVTSDCPLIDPEESDSVIGELTARGGDCDYASNVIRRSFPRGLDTEAFFRDALERSDRLAKSIPAREHVTYFMLMERPDLFVRHSVEDSEDNSDLRWTVDTAEDLAMVRRLYDELGLAQTELSYRDVLSYVRRNSEIAQMNQKVIQKSLQMQSL
jgi:spore coat polysaccharide biosynthesis protein SpsF